MWLFSTNIKYINILYFNLILFSIIVGLFITFTLFFDIYLFSIIPSSQIDLESFLVPIMIYNNADNDKLRILFENKGKTGIYMWTHNLSGKIYIGSAVDLSKRLKNYYFISTLKTWDNYISRALITHGYSTFSFSILEFIDISNLSLEESKNLILKREQYYLDIIFSVDEPNTYNILQVAGSLLGYKHTKESLAKMSLSCDNHPRGMLNKTHSAETKALMSETHKSENLSKETLAKLILTKVGKNNPMYNKSHTAETKAKMSATKGTAIYVYDTQGTLVNTFSSANKTALYFKCSTTTIIRYTQNGNTFLDKWKLSTSLIIKENQ